MVVITTTVVAATVTADVTTASAVAVTGCAVAVAVADVAAGFAVATAADVTVATAAPQTSNASVTFVKKGANATGVTGGRDFKLMFGDRGVVGHRKTGRGIRGVARVRSGRQRGRAEARGRKKLKGGRVRREDRGRGTGKEEGEGRRLVARRSSGGFSSALRALRVTGSEST